MLAELVEVVIGVDTHADTHTAAVLDARTGGVLARATVTSNPDGHAELPSLAQAHSGLRAWLAKARVDTAPELGSLQDALTEVNERARNRDAPGTHPTDPDLDGR